MNQGQQDYKQLLTEVIKKQIVILGPDITLAKARNVPGLIVADDGTVKDISGVPQDITQQLVNQFVQLSGEIVKKTMEPLLNMNQGSPTVAPVTPVQTQPNTPNTPPIVQAPSVNSGQAPVAQQTNPVQ